MSNPDLLVIKLNVRRALTVTDNGSVFLGQMLVGKIERGAHIPEGAQVLASAFWPGSFSMLVSSDDDLLDRIISDIANFCALTNLRPVARESM